MSILIRDSEKFLQTLLEKEESERSGEKVVSQEDRER